MVAIRRLDNNSDTDSVDGDQDVGTVTGSGCQICHGMNDDESLEWIDCGCGRQSHVDC